MGNIKKICIAVMIIMAVVSFINLFGLNAAGISVCLGVMFFFVNKAMEKQAFSGSGFDIKAIESNLKVKSIWFWIVMPLIMDAICILLAILLLPDYIDHVLARTENFVSFDKIGLLVVQLAVLALGEEIAWRAFFQKQLQKVLSIAQAIIISSVLFSLGHFTSKNLNIVAYDIFFVFINSVLYGIVFHKTNNAWISGISHFSANLLSVIVLMFL